MGRYVEGSAGFQAGKHAGVFPTGGKYCIWKIALNNPTRRNTTLCGKCFKALFGILFGGCALPTLRPRMAFWISAGLVSWGSLPSDKAYDRMTSLTTSMTPVRAGPLPAATETADGVHGCRLSWSPREQFLLKWPLEVKEWGMTFRSSLQFSGMDLYCEFYDGPQGLETCALHLVRILKYTDGFRISRIWGLAIFLLDQ